MNFHNIESLQFKILKCFSMCVFVCITCLFGIPNLKMLFNITYSKNNKVGTIVLFLAIEKSYVTLKCNSHFRIGNGKIELVMRMVTRTTKSNEPAFFNGAKNSLLSPTNFKKCH